MAKKTKQEAQQERLSLAEKRNRQERRNKKSRKEREQEKRRKKQERDRRKQKNIPTTAQQSIPYTRMLQDGICPVSYTHLDVYKRQVVTSGQLILQHCGVFLADTVKGLSLIHISPTPQRKWACW